MVSARRNPSPKKWTNMHDSLFALSRGKFDLFVTQKSWILEVIMKLPIDQQTSYTFHMSKEMSEGVTQPDIAVSRSAQKEKCKKEDPVFTIEWLYWRKKGFTQARDACSYDFLSLQVWKSWKVHLVQLLGEYFWENAKTFKLKGLSEMQVIFGKMHFKNTLRSTFNLNAVW